METDSEVLELLNYLLVSRGLIEKQFEDSLMRLAGEPSFGPKYRDTLLDVCYFILVVNPRDNGIINPLSSNRLCIDLIKTLIIEDNSFNLLVAEYHDMLEYCVSQLPYNGISLDDGSIIVSSLEFTTQLVNLRPSHYDTLNDLCIPWVHIIPDMLRLLEHGNRQSHSNKNIFEYLENWSRMGRSIMYLFYCIYWQLEIEALHVLEGCDVAVTDTDTYAPQAVEDQGWLRNNILLPVMLTNFATTPADFGFDESDNCCLVSVLQQPCPDGDVDTGLVWAIKLMTIILTHSRYDYISVQNDCGGVGMNGLRASTTWKASDSNYVGSVAMNQLKETIESLEAPELVPAEDKDLNIPCIDEDEKEELESGVGKMRLKPPVGPPPNHSSADIVPISGRNKSNSCSSNIGSSIDKSRLRPPSGPPPTSALACTVAVAVAPGGGDADSKEEIKAATTKDIGGRTSSDGDLSDTRTPMPEKLTLAAADNLIVGRVIRVLLSLFGLYAQQVVKAERVMVTSSGPTTVHEDVGIQHHGHQLVLTCAEEHTLLLALYRCIELSVSATGSMCDVADQFASSVGWPQTCSAVLRICTRLVGVAIEAIKYRDCAVTEGDNLVEAEIEAEAESDNIEILIASCCILECLIPVLGKCLTAFSASELGYKELMWEELSISRATARECLSLLDSVPVDKWLKQLIRKAIINVSKDVTRVGMTATHDHRYSHDNDVNGLRRLNNNCLILLHYCKLKRSNDAKEVKK